MIRMVILLLATLSLTFSYCPNPQKGIFLSLTALANRQNLNSFFQSFPTSTFNLTEQDKQQRIFQISELRYRLVYNNHYQKQRVIDSNTMQTDFGIVKLMTEFDYHISGGSLPIKVGHGSARTHLDSLSFRKQLSIQEGFVEWQPTQSANFTLTLKWAVQIPFNVLSQSDVLTIQAILNNDLGKHNLSHAIQTEINTYYQSHLKQFLNAEHLLTDKSFIYEYNQFHYNITHHVVSISLLDNIGLVAFIVFGSQQQQSQCPQLPSAFDLQFGGVQEVITLATIRNLIRQVVNDGLFTITLDNTWDVSLFQFYIGDLANAAIFAETLPAIQTIKAKCQCSDKSKLNIYPFDARNIYVQLPYSCTIASNEEDLLKLSVQLVFIAQLIAEKMSLKVKTKQIQTRKLTFSAIDKRFQVTNQNVAQMIVNAVLGQILETEVFGSNFPILSRNYAALYLKEDLLIFFDVSQPI